MEHFVWNVDPEFVKWGFFTPRYYGLLFGLGFFVGYQIMRNIFRKEGHNEEELQSLLTYMVVGTIVGARLGHVLFYQPDYYLSNPLEILKMWKGGLASHGGTIGVLLACYLFRKKQPQHSYLWLADRLAITTAFVAGCIRTGNFFNSEILGKPWDGPWAIIFARVDNIARHPAMLYEAAAYFTLFVVLLLIYRKLKEKTPQGLLLGILLTWVFASRFVIEFFKENQVDFEAGMTLNMGQTLSIPFVVIGILFITGKIQIWVPSLVASEPKAQKSDEAKTPKAKQKARPKSKKR
ncbi:MAG: prolipoprotein diacylglyceryl transferase [Pseudobacteriovorax sp.]|nr:prolipoprotein diacylglyceryl transferase [Pseudobacteriovorax sp.]